MKPSLKVCWRERWFESILYFYMPINVFGNSSSLYDNGNKKDSLFVQKPYLRTNYLESKIEEDIDLKN